MAVGTRDLRFKVLAQVVGAQAVDGLRNSINGLNNNTKTLANGLKLLAGAYSAREAIRFGQTLLDAGDNLNKLAQKTGASVSQLAVLQEQAELADVSFESLTAGLRKLSVNLVESANGNAEMSASFKKLGVNVLDSKGQVKGAGDVLGELQKKFGAMADGPAKAALAVKLFGKSGSEMVPLLNAASGEVSRFAQAMSGDFAARAEQFNDTVKMIGLNIKGQALEGFKQMLPALQEIAGAFNDLAKDDAGTADFMEDLGEAARLLALGLVTFLTPAIDLIDMAITGVKQLTYAYKGETAKIFATEDALAQRIAKRKEAQDKLGASLVKNSFVLGDGTTEEIRARQRAATEAQARKGGVQLESAGIGAGANTIRSMEEKLAKMRAETAAFGLSNAARERAVLLAELESKGLKENSKAYQKLAGDIEKTVNAREASKEKTAAQEYKRAQLEEIETRRLAMRETSMSRVEYEKMTEAAKVDAEVRKASVGATKEGAQAYKEAGEAIKEQRTALIDLDEQQRRTWSTGARQAMTEYVEMARNTAQQTKSLFLTAFQNMEDSLVSFVKTGQLNFQKLTDDILDGLIRMQVQAAMARTITGIASLWSPAAPAVTASANGNIMTPDGPLPLKKYASGGIARSPQISLFGEGRMPEAYVPLPDGRSIPVSMKSQGGTGGTMNVSVSVNVEKGTENTQSDSATGAQLGKLITAAVRTELVQQKRPGGLLA